MIILGITGVLGTFGFCMVEWSHCKNELALEDGIVAAKLNSDEVQSDWLKYNIQINNMFLISIILGMEGLIMNPNLSSHIMTLILV